MKGNDNETFEPRKFWKVQLNLGSEKFEPRKWGKMGKHALSKTSQKISFLYIFGPKGTNGQKVQIVFISCRPLKFQVNC